MCSAQSKNETRWRFSTDGDDLCLLNSELLRKASSFSSTPMLSPRSAVECQDFARESGSRLEALARQHEGALEELSVRLSAESLKSESLASKLEDLQQSRQADAMRSCEWAERLREECKEFREQNEHLVESNLLLKQELIELQTGMRSSRRHSAPASRSSASDSKAEETKPETTPEPEVKTESEPEDPGSPISPTSHSTACTGSEGRLRAALTGRKVSTQELREAIASVEAMLSQAKRELAARELRERRAAYEQLHAALEGDEEEPLAQAIKLAFETGVGEDEIIKAQNKLEELRSMTPEERMAQAASKRLAEAKRRSFQLVKRGEAAALKEHLEAWDEGESAMRWRNWKDHAGRSLLAYAKEARSVMVKECLERMLAPSADSAAAAPSTTPRPQMPKLVLTRAEDTTPRAPELVGSSPPPKSPREPTAPISPPPATPVRPRRRSVTPQQEDAASASPASSLLQPPTAASVRDMTPLSARTAALSKSPLPGEEEDEETAKQKSMAFRAVVKDDTTALASVLERLPREVWTRWYNKAGRDLLTLSQERRAPGCYVMLARAMGILLERKREAYEENETVWILIPGEVQPRHATVLEDTPGDAEDVLVEYWDVEGPPQRVQHCLVLKAN